MGLGSYFVWLKCGQFGVADLLIAHLPGFEKYKKEVDFIRKWSELRALFILSRPLIIFRPSTVFPGGLLPSLSLLLSTLHTATSGRFVVESISNIGPHYSRTLREWRRRFVAYFDVIEEALKKEYPGVFDGAAGEKELKVFWRKWICTSLHNFCSSLIVGPRNRG